MKNINVHANKFQTNSCLISIIVILYNTPLIFLNRCINSIKNQTYKNIEILIVDGGSNSYILNYLYNVCLLDKRIKVINVQKGYINQRIAGINNSNGKFVSFIDSDDYIDKNYIKILNKYITNGFDVVSGNVITGFKENNIFLSNTYNKTNFFREIIDNSNIIINVFKIYKKTLFKIKKINNDITYGDDLYLNYLITPIHKKIKHCVALDAKYFYYSAEKNTFKKYGNGKYIALFDFLYNLCINTNDVYVALFLKYHLLYFLKHDNFIRIIRLKKYRKLVLKKCIYKLNREEKNILKHPLINKIINKCKK